MIYTVTRRSKQLVCQCFTGSKLLHSSRQTHLLSILSILLAWPGVLERAVEGDHVGGDQVELIHRERRLRVGRVDLHKKMHSI